MDKEVKWMIVQIITIIAVIVGLICILINTNKTYNETNHGDDVQVTEWISPDGVHYWYQLGGSHSMLAPRYDESGNLVIETQQ